HAFGERVAQRAWRLPFAERDAERIVARLRARAGEDQIAEAGQADQRLRPRAERPAEAEQLGKAARHQRRGGAGAEPAAGDDAGASSPRVLGGAAELDPAQVGRLVLT